jgi:hypothetical protein
MKEWTYSGARLPDDKVVVSIKAGDPQKASGQAEFLDVQVVIPIPAGPSEPRIRLEALLKLRSAISDEIRRTEDGLADGVR